MREQHLDLAAFTRGVLKRLDSPKAGGMLAHIFMGVDRQGAIRRAWRIVI
jgi:hypothetical protein